MHSKYRAYTGISGIHYIEVQGRSQAFGRGGGGKEQAIENIILNFENN